MADEDLHQRISALVHEERELSSGDGADRAARRQQLEEQLDQLWDLLRQREARRENGGDPAAAEERPVAEVEGYLQ